MPLASDGDDPTAPTYAGFRAVSSYPGHGDADPPYDRDRPCRRARSTGPGRWAARTGVRPPATRMVIYEPNGHNIPSVFWDFLNASGPVQVNGQTQTAPLINPWFYASGLPISDAYWAQVKIGGRPTGCADPGVRAPRADL